MEDATTAIAKALMDLATQNQRLLVEDGARELAGQIVERHENPPADQRVDPLVPPKHARRGRPRISEKVNNVALLTLDTYEVVSGRKATKPIKDNVDYGPFLGLMRLVFGALEIRASPENRARWAIGFRKSSRATTEAEPR